MLTVYRVEFSNERDHNRSLISAHIDPPVDSFLLQIIGTLDAMR